MYRKATFHTILGFVIKGYNIHYFVCENLKNNFEIRDKILVDLI